MLITIGARFPQPPQRGPPPRERAHDERRLRVLIDDAPLAYW